MTKHLAVLDALTGSHAYLLLLVLILGCGGGSQSTCSTKCGQADTCSFLLYDCFIEQGSRRTDGGVNPGGGAAGGSPGPSDPPPQAPLAKELWDTKSFAESVRFSLATGEEAYGKNVVAWIQTASSVAKLNRAVTYGTLSETSGATFSWAASPSNQLVVVRSNGATFSIAVSAVAGDVLRNNFPSEANDSIEFTFTWQWAELRAKYGSRSTRWQGWFVNADGGRVDVDISSATVYDFGSYNGSWSRSNETTESGTVVVNGYAVLLNRETWLYECGGSGCTGSWLTDKSALSLTKSGTKWTITSKDDSDFDVRDSSIRTKLDFSGEVAKDGSKVGGQFATLVSQNGNVLNYNLQFYVGSDSISVGNRVVVR